MARGLETRILPYVIFFVAPILGRMTDQDDDVRLLATRAFAHLVALVPLEAGIADPPGFSADMLSQRQTERRFLEQLFDPKRIDPFKIPIRIDAELRSYQQDGVNWLAFLNRFQLHGILCDDMGLGKTLQTICVIASDHHMRRVRYEQSRSPDAVAIPSLVVCPLTVTGHWRQEILKFASHVLRPVLYVGQPADRRGIVANLGQYDVVITSYEILRNDIEHLRHIHWNYAVLDEGHVIKNPKAKLSLAVKEVKASHRLLLSGTPIQVSFPTEQA